MNAEQRCDILELLIDMTEEFLEAPPDDDLEDRADQARHFVAARQELFEVLQGEPWTPNATEAALMRELLSCDQELKARLATIQGDIRHQLDALNTGRRGLKGYKVSGAARRNIHVTG